MKNRVKKLIDKFEYVSFDIFDTLIERTVFKPTDVFYEVGKVIFKDKEKALKFKEDRKSCEALARQTKANGEVNLDEIYNKLIKYSEKEKTELMSLEKQTELNVCERKKDTIDIFEYAVSSKKKVFLITDMYLSSEFITEILLKNKITGFEKIYVSNEVGVNKISGKLFEFVKEQNGIENRKLLHFGDSLKADCLGAFKAKVKFVLTKRKDRLKRILKRR